MNENLWGQGYRIMVNSLRIRQLKVEMEDEERMTIVRDLFPEDIDGS